ncbi:MAG: DUF1549 domain-containing protein, partial [Planctomycetota bacterium]|nr:DUF1549 domain-containing protein [Planctomycetota bacterium]
MQKLSVPQLACFLFLLGGGQTPCMEEIEFNRDIRPILADKCFHCHGPDRATREAGLRLDTEAAAVAKRDGDPVIVPGSPDRSLLIQRIIHPEASQRMPPPDSQRVLLPKEIKLLTDWIQQGARWQKHWSFVAPQKIEPPRIQSEWVRNGIDRFVWARLKQEDLSPSIRADKTTLIRRLSQDLIGLPPSLTEIKEFVEDDSADAYEKAVDRLLDSPHYGERMAQVWLDAARYADSHGYSLDRRRVMWPWRDWVIKAYNDNKPFNEFATEQLAGDLLPDATVEQKVATGFNRNHPIQSEGGVIDEEYRIETVVDRVEVTSAVFLGLTMGCGRCHDHKYEPISQKEFYQFFAFFNNVPETAHVGNGDKLADPPLIKAPSVLAHQQINQLEIEIEKLLKTPPLPISPSQEIVDRVWFGDTLPKGAQAFGNGGGPQEFLFVHKSPEHPVYAGKQSSFRKSVGRGQHGFQGASDSLRIREGDKLFAYVYVHPGDVPREIMLQWNVGGSWEHRAYWGENLIPWGTDQTVSRRFIGKLPAAGKWVRLEVLAQDVGLEGKTVNGWAFTQFGGTLHWDNAGKTGKILSPRDLRIQGLRHRLEQLRQAAPTVMIMSEMSPPRKTFILARGQYDAPTDQQVKPQVPSVLGKLAGKKPDRLALANWMFAEENPLVARVAVNRYWQMYFGNGLVRTLEDFGTQGSPPTHPDLLDWLAREFVSSGWDVKAMQKMIVMSATYQ